MIDKIITPMSMETNFDDGFYVSDKDFFVVRKRGMHFSYRDHAEKVWPIGSEMKVIYNPNKPKQAYVEKVVVHSDIVGIVFAGVGALFVLMAIISYLIFA